MTVPARSQYVVVGAGIHGLSTAYHLAKELRTRKLGSGSDVLVLDKSSPGSGASGIACGVVRNNYFQPAMSELMQACVEVWESDPAAYHYNPVGYMALGASVQESDLIATFERQERIGLGGALFLRKVELQHCLTAIREGYRHSQRDVALPEGLAEPERPVLGALLRKPRQRLQPRHPACSIAPPAQPLGDLDQTRSLAMKKPLVRWRSGLVSKNSGRFG